MTYWLLQVSLWNKLNVLFVCWIINVCVFIICAQHDDGLVELQGMDFTFSMSKIFLKAFLCLNVLAPRISWRFLLRLNTVISLVWNTPWNSLFSCRIFQFLFTILHMLGSVLLYVTDSIILFLLLLSLFLNRSFFQFYLLSWFVHLELLP